MAGSSNYSPEKDLTTAQRFEAKYRINDCQALMLRDFMEPYVVPDKHAIKGAEYPINTLYLDSRSYQSYWSSAMGEKNRFKLRIRAYTDDPEDPVFFEIKRRVNQIITKERAVTSRSTIDSMLRGERLSYESLLKPSYEEWENLCRFRDYLETMGAIPQVMVHYQREAYVCNRGEPVRITFDRELTTLPVLDYHPGVWTLGPHWTPIYETPVILEIKFTNTFPEWVGRMIQKFHLRKDSFAKYLACMDTMNRMGVLPEPNTIHNEDPLWSMVV